MATKTKLLQELVDDDRKCRLDVVFGEAYHQIIDETSEVAVLGDLLAGIADALGLPFAWMERHLRDRIMVPVATSGSGPLHDELHRLPEHDDDSVMGNGPGARALRENAPVVMKVGDKGFLPWKKAARAQKVAAVLAVPVLFTFQGRQQVWVALFAARTVALLAEEKNRMFLQQISERLGEVCAGLCRQRQQHIVCRSLADAGNAAFITDTQGTIIWANQAFSRLTGHEMNEVIGHNPRILKSGKQGFRYYDRLWRTITSGKVWSGETVDRDRHGELYTIHQTVSPVKTNGNVTHYISIHEDISGEKAMQAARERARRVDELTGLMTAATFEERYQRAVEACAHNSESMALLLVSLNEFDTLMRTLGRDIEELVLETMGDRIRDNLQEDDFAAHLQGGDFGIVLRSVGSGDEARALGEQILEVLDEPFPLLGDRLYLSRGLGVAFVPDDATDADELMRIADARAGGQQ